MPNVRVLIAEEPNQVLDKKHQTRLPGIVGWNLIQLSYKGFVQKYGTKGFDSFMCPEGVNPLFFSQLCIFLLFQRMEEQYIGSNIEVMSQNIENTNSPKIDDLSQKRPIKF